jgi:hypothetical protein
VANHALNEGGAVPPLASARIGGTIRAGKEISKVAARHVLLKRCQRIARLCVLMNPILPGARSIGPDRLMRFRSPKTPSKRQKNFPCALREFRRGAQVETENPLS